MFRGLILSFLLFLGGGQIASGTWGTNIPAPLTVNGISSGTNNIVFETLMPTLTTGQSTLWGLGHDGSTDHEFFVSFKYDSTTLNNNAINITPFGGAPTMSFYPTGVTGAATAPTGACSPNGVWQFTQDGHATFCSAGTWTTKI